MAIEEEVEAAQDIEVVMADIKERSTLIMTTPRSTRALLVTRKTIENLLTTQAYSDEI